MRYKVPLLLVALMALLPGVVLSAPPPEAQGQIYVVQADDWLGTLAEKFYGDPLAYPVLVKATNDLATTDNRFNPINDPSRLPVGQTLFAPTLPAVPPSLLAQAPLERKVMPNDVIVNHSGPSQEQLSLLSTLEVVGQPPELTNQVWLNSDPLKLAELRGKVVLVEFWTFG